jgi:hypothetical protein
MPGIEALSRSRIFGTAGVGWILQTKNILVSEISEGEEFSGGQQFSAAASGPGRSDRYCGV